MEVGKKYLIIYDDKNYKPIKKVGFVIEIRNNLFRLEGNEEWLNMNNIIRAVPFGSMDGVRNEGSKK